MSDLPIGEHLVCIVAAETKVTKGGDGGFLALTLEALSGEHDRHTHVDRLNLKNAKPHVERMASERYAAYFAAAGVNVSRDIETLLFKPFLVEIGPQTNAPGRMDVKKVSPYTDPVFKANAREAAWKRKEQRKALKAPPPEPIAYLAPAEPESPQPPKLDRGLLLNGQTPAPSLPFGSFGAFGRWIEDTARAASAPPDYVALALLTCAAALVGNARGVRPEPTRSTWEEPLALWTCLVGPPSSGKTPALSPFNKVLEKLEADDAKAFAPYRDEIEARREAAKGAESDWKAAVAAARKAGEPIPLKPPEANIPPEAFAPRSVVRGATLEALIFILQNNPNGLLQMNDELAAWIGDMGRYSNTSDRPHWLSMYSGQPITLDRVKYAGEPRHVPTALVSVLGGMQPDKVAEVLKSPDDGFIARFLYIWPDAQPLVRSHVQPDMALLERALGRLHHLKLAPSPMFFADDASELFFEFRQAMRGMSGNAEGVLAGWIGKGDGVVARIAGVLTLLDWAYEGQGPAPLSVGKDAVQRAGDLWAYYLLPMARRAFGDAARPNTERLAIRLLKEIRTRRVPVVNSREVRREWKLHDLRETKPVGEALSYLQEAGWVRPASIPTGGRPRDDWEVNPELFL